MIHAFDPNMAPDCEFEPGEIAHLVAGNRGRLLDPRRTPITIVAIDLPSGQFTLRVEAFEDRGATWDVPFEWTSMYQFARGSARATESDVTNYREAIARFSIKMPIACDSDARRDTEARIARRSADARGASLRAFLGDLADLDAAFASVWSSNPHAGEFVKGHRIVLAELGLVPYAGTVARTNDIFEGARSKERRARHIIDRLAFMRATFAERGEREVLLYRGMACAEPDAPRNFGFVSATFARDVAQSCATKDGIVIEQRVPIERLFMTHVETPELNARFEECEAVLLWDGSNSQF